ncbi:heparinase II/III domain-containing protein [Vibrio rumoiensis]|uniref:Alginate lyase n=1 Tax=Vibrio rumoiensis 1S-45 TaxID=1188252 RepID=A0A1E5DYM5_9VIBR|nr:heparinase II/III family protein [Vibrio rumoiensis]OEF22759.1 alginate lyase [Vibrio rumoiensis 1S-45]
MLQFTQEEMLAIRNKVTNSVLNRLIEDNKMVISNQTLITPDNRATWNLYYFCPEHAVRLDWRWDKPTEHCCPIDGKAFYGEPYDGAWWRGLNGLNSKACYELGLLWQLTQQISYFEKVREILLGYAKHYPDYQPHGGIPYNGPGKANAQTLCEANCHLDFVRGYDFIREQLSVEDRVYIEKRLLREGAEFLIEHRADQLHNHEMKTSATIGVIGLIIDEPEYIDFALNSKYGLKYQLAEGVNSDGMWFEGSIHYHYYALQALLAFEKVAYRTQYSVHADPNYYKMLAFPLSLLSATGDFPRLNDCIAGQEKLSHSHLFEFAYRQFDDPLFARALINIYQHSPRDNLDALLYGVPDLPVLPPLLCQPQHAPTSGLTKMYDEQSGNMLLLKHAPYGGEHDHYDRLGLIICRNGREILPDIGTTGYGAELHYGYYKNTVTHNTLAVEQENQPPAIPVCLDYQQTSSFTFVDTLVDWSETVLELDSHTIKQWDDETYTNVSYRRSILWLPDIAIDINQVLNPHNKQLDLIWHVRGELCVQQCWQEVNNPLNGPLNRMHSCRQHSIQGLQSYHFDIQEQPKFHFHLYSLQNSTVLTGLAPDNPATQDLSYLLLRNKETSFKAIAIYDLTLTQSITVDCVEWKNDFIRLELTQDTVKKKIEIDLENAKILLS